MTNNHIIIGIGGTGGNVIKIFRQQVVDKYGDIVGVEEIKNIEFLYVDSNPSEFDEKKWEYQGKDIKLSGSSTLIMKAGVLNDRLQDYSTRPEFLGNDSDWGDVLSDKELAKKAGNQMRRLGRVYLIPNIKDIVNRVAQKEKNLSSNKRAITLIHIVTGLAGGTGSGSIVDITAHLLKYFEKRSADVKINLYLKIPEIQVPDGWGGQFTGPLRGVSFYQINGYAALKEINGLASGVFEPYNISEKRQRIKTDNRLQAAYIVAERNNETIGFSDVISPIASLLFLKTITSGTEKDDKSTLSLPQILDKVDNAENNTINASTYWGLAGKYRIPGIYKVGVPKVQIRESFAYLLVLNAFNKLLFKNFDEVAGKGYLGVPPRTSEIQREKNHITTNLRSTLLDEWYLTYDYLILDEPMIDKNNKSLTEGRDDYSFKVAYKREYNKQYTLLSTTKLYKGKFIKDNEILKYLQITVNDYFNKDCKGFGYERYYSNMVNCLSPISDFLAFRIKDKLFGTEGGKQSRTYPLESYIELLLCIVQEYLPGLEKDLTNKQLEFTKLAERKQDELKNLNEEYINSFGIIFNNPKKRENAINNFNDALEKFWLYTISLKGISFAIQLINSHLKNKLLDVKKDVENDVKSIADRRNKLNQEYEEERRRLSGSDEIKGFKSITNDEGLEKFQTALMKDKPRFDEVMVRLENLIFENMDSVLEKVETLKNKDLPIMKQAYNEIDNLLSERNFRELLNEDDNFYNAHVVEVLYNKYKEANNPKLKDLFSEMYSFSSPLSTVSSPEGKGGIETHSEKIVVLPQLQGVRQNNTQILNFYSELKKTIESTLGLSNDSIKEIKDDKFKNEITIAQFLWPIRPDQIDNVVDLKKEYDELKKIAQINFLMHTEDTQNLVELIPPKSPDEYKSMILPFLLIIDSIDGGFELYGSENFWKVSQNISTKIIETQTSAHDEEKVDIFLESNNIEDFLKLDFKKLDNKNSTDIISGFIHPFVFNAIRSKAEKFIKKESNVDVILKNIQKFLDEYLIKVKNDSSDKNYKQFKNAYLTVHGIINNQ